MRVMIGLPCEVGEPMWCRPHRSRSPAIRICRTPHSGAEDALSEIANRFQIGMENVPGCAERFRSDVVRWRKDDALECTKIGVLALRGEVRNAVRWDVRRHVVTDGVEQSGERHDDVAASELVRDSGEHLLLTRCSREVAVTGALARPNVRERGGAIEVVCPSFQVETGPVREWVMEGRIVNGAVDNDVNPTDGIDHLAQTGKVDRGEVMDLCAEQLADGG